MDLSWLTEKTLYKASEWRNGLIMYFDDTEVKQHNTVVQSIDKMGIMDTLDLLYGGDSVECTY